MELIETLEDLKVNAKILSSYIKAKDLEKKKFVSDLIKNGKCFAVFKIENTMEFFPSKFLGYIGNNKDRHEKAKKEKTVHGILSNHRIDEILKAGCMSNESYEKGFQKFCNSYGIASKNQTRKFWLPVIEID